MSWAGFSPVQTQTPCTKPLNSNVVSRTWLRMKLHPGRSYRTRDGLNAGPIVARGGRSHSWEGRIEGMEAPQYWTDDGNFFASGKPHNLDLVERARRPLKKAIDQMTLAGYRRGLAKLRG